MDELSLNFSPATVVLLNVILGLIMFGVALDVRVSELRSLRHAPVAVAVGLLAQFLMLPALTFGLTQVLDPAPSIALGMILVGASPGGNMSNFITHVARGNTLLSVGMTGVSTILAVVLTPLNFAFWGSLDEDTDALMREVSLNPVELIGTVALLLGVPVALGMWVRAKKPALADRLHKPMRIASLVFFGHLPGGRLRLQPAELRRLHRVRRARCAAAQRARPRPPGTPRPPLCGCPSGTGGRSRSRSASRTRRWRWR